MTHRFDRQGHKPEVCVTIYLDTGKVMGSEIARTDAVGGKTALKPPNLCKLGMIIRCVQLLK